MSSLPSISKSSSRGLSPATVGHATHGYAADSSQRLMHLSMARTHAHVIDCIPIDFVEPLKPKLRIIADRVSKMRSAQLALQKLKKHESDGTFPAQLGSMHLPSFQTSKEFTEASPEAWKTFNDHFSAAKKQLLTDAIAVRTLEVAELQRISDLEHAHGEVHEAAKEIYAAQLTTGKHPTWNQDGTIGAWVNNPAIVLIGERFLHDLPTFVNRIIAIENSRWDAEHAKAGAKVALKEAADVQMADATAGSSKTPDQTDKELAAALKRLGFSKPPGNPTAGGSKKKPAAKKGSATTQKKKVSSTSRGAQPHRLPKPLGKKPANKKGKSRRN
ncbi:hypothetical protein PLICRDRAFT_179047 [Plicaturopsis crispa FD-325 SS-3]|uniref:Uncharacterized protein n=1 Tax=Plicaturopsis crispa FD-325 SS-3 TaxID=944288 RepID=A0A0C9SYX9_PLICR|nr:hypothetical protein PLICRDRAFT_179047 [Plicaturopsis crispa FD-325 SS-3]